MKRVVAAMAIDIFLWAYTLLVSYKVIYQKMIADIRYAEFSWNQPVYALAIGALVALGLFLFGRLSIG